MGMGLQAPAGMDDQIARDRNLDLALGPFQQECMRDFEASAFERIELKHNGLRPSTLPKPLVLAERKSPPRPRRRCVRKRSAR